MIDTDTLFLLLRVAVALGVVVALLWFVRRRFAKGGAKPGSSAAPAAGGRRPLLGMRSRGSGASVRGRHALGQKSSVAVVEFDGREFLLGVTEQGVTVLHAAGRDGAAVAPDEAAEAAPVEPMTSAAPTVAAPAQDFAAHLAAARLAAEDADGQPAERLAPAFAAAAPEPAAPASPPMPAYDWSADPGAPLVAPRYARSTAAAIEVDDEQPAYLVPAPVPVRHLLTGTFVAEVELLPMPGPMPAAPTPAGAPVTQGAVPRAAAPVPSTPMPPAPTRAALLPNTSMIPVVVMAPSPGRAPAAAVAVSEPAPRPQPLPEPVVAAPPPRLAEPASASAPVAMQWPVLKPSAHRAEPPAVDEPRAAGPLAGSILSPDTWRRTADALRALR